LLTSIKGKNGGFKLGKPAQQILVIDVIQALEGKKAFTECLLGLPVCDRKVPCPLHRFWDPIRNNLWNILNKNLQQLSHPFFKTDCVKENRYE